MLMKELRCIWGTRWTLRVLLVTCLLSFGLFLSDARAETTITVLTPEAENPQAIDWYQKVLKPAFEKATGIKLDLQVTQGWTGYQDKLAVLFASGKAPDVFTVPGEQLGSYAQSKMVLPLDQWVSAWKERDDFPSAAWSDVTIDGKIYAVPYRLDQRTLLYRTDFFEQAGLDPKHPPATWDELVSFGRKLVIRDNNGEFKRDAINLYPAGDFVGIFVFQNGGRLVTPDRLKADFDSRPAIEAFQFVVDLSRRYQLGSPWGSPWKGANAVITGTAAMEYVGAWVMTPQTLSLLGDQRSLAVAVPPKKVNRSGWLYVNKWGIANTSKNPEAAWKFIEFMTRPENMAAISHINSHLPARLSVIRGFSPWKEDARWAMFLAATMETIALPPVSKLGEVMTALEQTVRAVLEGKQGLEQAVATQAERITKLLQSS